MEVRPATNEHKFFFDGVKPEKRSAQTPSRQGCGFRLMRPDLDCGTRASAKLQHASTVTPSWDDTLKLLDELCLGERLREPWQNRLGLRFHFSEAGRDDDRKFRPLPFYRVGKLQAVMCGMA
jgi:hypothetical protein